MEAVVYERQCQGGECGECACPVLIFGYFRKAANAATFCEANEGFFYEPIEFLDEDSEDL